VINFCGKFWPLGPTSFFSALLERLDKGMGGVLAPDFSSSRNESARDVVIKQHKDYTYTNQISVSMGTFSAIWRCI